MRHSVEAQRWLSVEEAWRRLEAAVPPNVLEIEKIPVEESVSRILVTAPEARVDLPPADNSAMDGFAICHAEIDEDGTVPISQRIPAGSENVPLKKGTAARIFTGGEVPSGADTVVMQEMCDYDEERVRIRTLPARGANIRHAAGDIAQGELLLGPGRRIRPQDVGLLAAAGIDTVEVFRRIRVALIATGDELVKPGQPLTRGTIYESSLPMVTSLLQGYGCQVEALHCSDDQSATRAVLESSARHADLVATIGGVSVGEEDHVKAALASLGETKFWKIGMKPGKPFLCGSILGTPLLGMPGNPVSAWVTCGLFCKPFISLMQGSNFAPPRIWNLKADFSFDRTSDRQEYLRGTRIGSGETVRLATSQSSASLRALCEADVLIVVRPGQTLRPGDRVDVISIAELLSGF